MTSWDASDIPTRRLTTQQGFEANLDYLRPSGHAISHGRAGIARTRASSFWYRQSPQPLESWRFIMRYGNLSRVDPVDPPLDVAGMTRVQLDPSGKLVELVVVPSPVQDINAPASATDWTALLAAGGYDSAKWTPVAPLHAAVLRHARGVGRDVAESIRPARASRGRRVPGPAGLLRSDLPVVNAVAQGGVHLYVCRAQRLALIVFTGAAIILGAAVFASRNLRAGRGDRRGAFRLSALIFVTMCGVVPEAHVASLGEVTLVIMALAWALLVASCCWVGYLAAEPYVRRRWPRVLVSWVRPRRPRARPAGRPRRAHRMCGGTMLAVLGFGGILVPGWFGFAPELVPADIIGVAYGLQRVTAVLVWRVGQACHSSCCGVPLALARSFIATPMVGGHRIRGPLFHRRRALRRILLDCARDRAFVNALFVLLCCASGFWRRWWRSFNRRGCSSCFR